MIFIKIIFISTLIFFLGCTSQKERTDTEMFELAEELFKDYLFELRVDNKLFALPIIEEKQSGTKSYRWLTAKSVTSPIGVELHIPRQKKMDPEWIQIGSFDDWRPLMGTAPSPPENEIYKWFFWE